MSRIILSVSILLFSSFGLAQQNGGQSGVIEKYGPRRQISTIVYMGLAGAVLGLSTLSFYGRPQDKLTNIPIGFGVGVVLGTIYMTYQAAANPNEFYREASLQYKPMFKHKKSQERMASDMFFRPESPRYFLSVDVLDHDDFLNFGICILDRAGAASCSPPMS